MANDNVTQLFEGDPRLDKLYEDILKIIEERAVGKLAISHVLGILELIKYDLLKGANDE